MQIRSYANRLYGKSSASSATRDLQHKRIEFSNAVMEVHGFPIFYFPVHDAAGSFGPKRQTGAAGAFHRFHLASWVFSQRMPYYIVINGSSDITLTPIIAVKTGPALDANYRKAFNNGILNIDLSGGRASQSDGTNAFGNVRFSPPAPSI